MAEAEEGEDAAYEEDEEEVSELGKREHWEDAYTRELGRFRESGGEDVGEVWFGEDTQAAMVDLVCRLTDDAAASGRGPPTTSDTAGRAAWRAVDLGCGNGALLVALAKEGFISLTGVDYVQSSIDLSRAVVDRAGFSAVALQTDDVLDSALASGAFWLALDKGTFDAIGLQANAATKRSQYLATVLRVLAPGGLMVITSCNSTRDEITEEFLDAGANAASASSEEVTGGEGGAGGAGEEPGADSSSDVGGSAGGGIRWRLEVVDWVRTYPVFRFCGVEGTKVCTVGFRKVPSSGGGGVAAEAAS